MCIESNGLKLATHHDIKKMILGSFKLIEGVYGFQKIAIEIKALSLQEWGWMALNILMQ